MCGVVGIVSHSPVNLSLYDALTVLQHRGQDAAGIVTLDEGNFRQRKANGLVSDVFQQKHMRRLRGNIGIGQISDGRFIICRRGSALLRQFSFRHCACP